MAGLTKARRGVDVVVGTKRDDQHIPLECSLVGDNALRHRIERTDSRLQKVDAGLHDLPIGMAHLGRQPAPEHDVELRETKDEGVAFVDERDVQPIPEGVRQDRRQLESTKPRAQHQHSRSRHLSRLPDGLAARGLTEEYDVRHQKASRLLMAYAVVRSVYRVGRTSYFVLSYTFLSSPCPDWAARSMSSVMNAPRMSMKVDRTAVVFARCSGVNACMIFASARISTLGHRGGLHGVGLHRRVDVSLRLG